MDRISTDVALHASTTERVTQHDQVKQYRHNKNLKLLHNITHRNTTPPGHCCCCERWQFNSRVTSFTDSFLLRTNERFITRFILVRLKSANNVSPK